MKFLVMNYKGPQRAQNFNIYTNKYFYSSTWEVIDPGVSGCKKLTQLKKYDTK